MKKIAFILIVAFCLSCNKDREIKALLNGSTPMDRIQGCYQAMETDDLSYVPLLLGNSRIQAVTTDIRHKGTSVYQADMCSLTKLLKVTPPDSVTQTVDTVNVEFFIHYWENYKRKHANIIRKPHV